MTEDHVADDHAPEEGQLDEGFHLHGAVETEDPDAARRHVAQLLAVDHVSLLVGSGFSTALALATDTATVDMSTQTFDLDGADAVERHAARIAHRRGVEPNLEDQLTAALTLIAGLEVQEDDSKVAAWREQIHITLTALAARILEMEGGIAGHLPAFGGDRADVQRLMCEFVAGFGLRGPSSPRLHLFTTNYDRLLELACDMAGLRTTDRFVGRVLPRFVAVHEHVDMHYPERRSAPPRPVAGVVRVCKLHGSIDWAQNGSDIIDLRIPVGGPAPWGDDATDAPLMIYPNAMKDTETTQYPYAPLFRDMSGAIARPQSVLFTYGYGFGDSHINRVISEMLSVPNTHLCIVAYGDETGRIAAFLQDVPTDRWSLLLGPELASLERFVQLLPRRSLARDADQATGSAS